MVGKPKIFIIGAARGIGHWFVEKFLSSFITIFDVYACDISFDEELILGEAITKIDVSKTYEEVGELIGSRDIVIFSVPIDVLDICAANAAKALDKNITVINFCSAQCDTNRILKENLSTKCEIVGLHPMFGPAAASVLGQNFVLTDSQNPVINRELKWLINQLTNEGAYLEYSTSEVHDRMMNVMQALVHFTYLSFGKFLADNQISLKDILKFQTLPSAYFFSFVARVLTQDKRTYANIQLKSGAKEARKEILEAATQIATEVDNAENTDALVEKLDELAKGFPKEELESVMKMTEASIIAFDNDAQHIQDLILSNSLIAVNCGPENGIFVGQIVQQNKEGYLLRKSVFKLDGDLKTKKKFAFYGNELEEYYELANLQHSDFDLADVQQTFLEVDRKSSAILSQEERDEWLKTNVEAANAKLELQFSRYDHDLIDRWVDTIFNESNGRIELDVKNVQIEGVRNVTASTIVPFFPPLTKSKISDHVRDVGIATIDEDFRIIDAT